MIKIIDDVLPDPHAYLSDVRQLAFKDRAVGKDLFKGIALPTRKGEVELFSEAWTGADCSLSFFRKSPKGQEEPNFIHCDEAMGKFTGIYYMNPEPAEGDGTAFWEKEGEEWKMTRLVPAKFNRLLLFSAELHHSRAIFDNYGEGEGARLIQVIFLRDPPAPKGVKTMKLTRLPDWQERLHRCLNEKSSLPYRYGSNDCACLARSAVEAVTGVDVAPGVDMPKGWIAAAKLMISRGWNSVEDMATELLGDSVDPSESRPGDIVSYEMGGDAHLAVRIGSTAVAPMLRGTEPIDPIAWRRCWKVG